MYELIRIKTATNATKDRPKVERIITHGPILIGLYGVFLRERDNRFFRTSVIEDVSIPHEYITRFTTKSGSVYELRQI